MLFATIGGLAAVVICGREMFGMYWPEALARGGGPPGPTLGASLPYIGASLPYIVDIGGGAIDPGICCCVAPITGIEAMAGPTFGAEPSGMEAGAWPRFGAEPKGMDGGGAPPPTFGAEPKGAL
mmetsp:Transcript_105176/g.304201  ORF Transcript_105176/g.304201 Transcript_105176/m.304201 type:complete len:124 (+) Transcript_105176:190-561(+)